ncbi:uncharacterized protein PG998_013050 [Apiospora kogelbergensis]|uniref:uncharacterized protein n=1 Tax=Apiospora kogelbergensis TaxID=1337665 RepID=UPI003131C700
MRVMGPDLAILSAERYDDGLRAQRAASHGPATATKRAPGKRARKQPSVDQDEPDEEKKRARGRPRLDTTDQTPQEAGRRRTQIRLAQRAYRDRKESAITNLEREVESLKATNGQMTQAYQDVLNYAASNGLLDAKSELGRRLLRLEALASKSNDVYDDYDSFSPDGGNEDMQLPSDQRQQSEPSVSSSENVNSSGSSVSQASVKPDSTQPLWAGVMVSHEPVGEADAPRAPPLYPTLYGGPGSHPPGPTGYEIIAQPTSQNASFAPQLSFDPSYGMSSWAPSPWASLPSPSTLAYQEPSFARRLHRSALQRAAHLVTMKNPPSETVLRVFGFARLFETLEQIRERTLGLLTRSERESLFHQEYPLPAPRGHGHAFSGHRAWRAHVARFARLARPAQGRLSVHHGPHGPSRGQDKGNPRESRGEINLPGFDGQFWDPDEVQIYLMHNGVEIPPAVDHHVVELENGAFGDPPSHAQGEDDRPQFAGRPTPCSTMSSEAAGTGTSASTGESTVMTMMGPGRFAGPSSRPDVMSATTNTDSVPFWPQGHSSAGHFPPMGAAAPSTLPVFPTHPFPASNALGVSVGMGGSSYSSNTTAQGHPSASRRVLRIDVDQFLHQLLIKMTCLGRSPGIRPKDVDLAFWASVTDPSPA